MIFREIHKSIKVNQKLGLRDDGRKEPPPTRQRWWKISRQWSCSRHPRRGGTQRQRRRARECWRKQEMSFFISQKLFFCLSWVGMRWRSSYWAIEERWRERERREARVVEEREREEGVRARVLRKKSWERWVELRKQRKNDLCTFQFDYKEKTLKVRR